MTIKQQAYRAHAFLQARGVTSLKRSHIHELLAVTVGYTTYAAFQHDATWCEVPFSLAGIDPDPALLAVRCLELGLPADQCQQIAETLPRFQLDAGYAPLRFEELIAAIDGDEGSACWWEWAWVHLVEPAHGIAFYFERQRVLLDGLEAAAERGVTAAHLAIAKLLESEAMLFGDEAERARQHVRREGTWMSPFVSFAEVEANNLLLEGKYRHHLLAAARGGSIRALMASAERYGDPMILELTPSSAMEPMGMVTLAEEHGDREKVRYWLTAAARQGDIHAMRELILDHDEAPDQAWVWMYLSRMLGDDLSRDHFEAINEDGTPYDDDVGGPAYVAGDEGIDLDRLSADADAAARRTAAQLLAQINDRPDHV